MSGTSVQSESQRVGTLSAIAPTEYSCDLASHLIAQAADEHGSPLAPAAPISNPAIPCVSCNGTGYVCCACGEAIDQCLCPMTASGEAPDRQPCDACSTDDAPARPVPTKSTRITRTTRDAAPLKGGVE